MSQDEPRAKPFDKTEFEVYTFYNPKTKKYANSDMMGAFREYALGPSEIYLIKDEKFLEIMRQVIPSKYQVRKLRISLLDD